MEYKKFIYEDSINNHWDYCCENHIPFIQISNKGIKYSQISFDCWPLTTMKRFSVLNFGDHIIPLYELYAANSSLPKNHFSCSGGSSNLVMSVLKNDVEWIASQLFDLLVKLGKMDEDKFKEAPFELNDEGFNSEGYHVAGVTEDLKELNNEKLTFKYGNMEKNGNFKYRPRLRLIYENEIASRGINIKDVRR